MKLKFVARWILSGMFSLGMITNLYALKVGSDVPGTFWLAGEESAPYPMNPHPECEVVEESPGIYIVDDTALANSDEEAAVSALRAALGMTSDEMEPPPDDGGTNDPPSQEELDAQYQAWLAQLETNRLSTLPWLHEPIRMPDGTPASSLQSLMDAQAMMASSNADAIIAQQQAALDDAIAWGATNGWPAVIGGDGGPRGYLVGREGDMPDYLMPHDLGAAITISTTNVWPGGPTGFSLNGTNTVIRMWDEASPRLTHIEFGSRVTELDGNTTNSDHSTAVAGMLAAGGVLALYSNGVPIGFAAKGEAFAAQVQARDLKLDLGEMTGAIGTNHMRLSNQSYGSIAGWYFDSSIGMWEWFGNPEISGTEDPRFGNYTTNAANHDTLIQNAPTYLQVWSSGNDQGEAPLVQPTNHVERTGNTNAYRPPDGDEGGFDTLAQQACAKNVLTVGAVLPLPNGYNGPTNLVLTSFSSCGPTDDGRIKPDVVADGTNNVVPVAGSDSNYVYWAGTSFAAPSVCGAVDLLSQFYKQLHPNASEPLASTLKGLVLHTADSATTNAGPSYRFGWGLMNTRTGATLINQDATNGLKNQIKEVLLTNGTSIQLPVVALGGTNALKVTICWIDPAGTPNAVTNLDNPSPKLVNDLDLRVISPNGTTNFPWILNPDLTNKTSAARSALATTGDDDRNNVEQVRVAQPTNATYLLSVTHKGNLQSNATQWVSILLSGNVPQQPPPLVVNQIVQTATNQIAIGWPAVVGQLYQVQALNALGTTNWANMDGIISARLTNVVVRISMSTTNSQQFYRVVQLP